MPDSLHPQQFRHQRHPSGVGPFSKWIRCHERHRTHHAEDGQGGVVTEMITPSGCQCSGLKLVTFRSKKEDYLATKSKNSDHNVYEHEFLNINAR
jgi:hypothetical protein